MTVQSTPDFDEPPALEVALGVEFLPLQGWGLPHFGLYWQDIRERYPNVDEQPPLPSTIERFGRDAFGSHSVPRPVFSGAGNNTRCLFSDEFARRLIQLQNGRFIVNWRKVDDSDACFNFPELRTVFEREWNHFGQFLDRNGLDQPKAVQCDVNYVNHINSGRGWRTVADLPDVIAPWSGRHSGTFLPVEENVGLNVSYLMPGNRGRLHVSMGKAVRMTDALEIIQLNLIARGAPVTGSTEDVLAWLDLGRDWVVRGFADFTSDRMHKELWGKPR